MASEMDVTRVFTYLISAFPNFTPAAADADIGVPSTLDIYRDALADLDYDVLRAAAKKCLADCKWFPTIAELRQAAAALVAPERTSGGEAWGLVCTDVRRGVGYPLDIPIEPTITDPLILRAVAAVGGWKLLQLANDKDDIAHRARFIEAYEALAARGRSDARQMPEVLAVRERHQEASAVLVATAARLAAGSRRPS